MRFVNYISQGSYKKWSILRTNHDSSLTVCFVLLCLFLVQATTGNQIEIDYEDDDLDDYDYANNQTGGDEYEYEYYSVYGYEEEFPDCKLKLWTDYKKSYGKHHNDDYGNLEDRARYRIFCINRRKIKQFNKLHKESSKDKDTESFDQYVINNMTDWYQNELDRLYMLDDLFNQGLKAKIISSKEFMERYSHKKGKLHEELFWHLDYVRYQGQCSSSWLMAAVDLLDSRQSKKIKKDPDNSKSQFNLEVPSVKSVQQVIDCYSSMNEHSDPCCGGNPVSGLKLALKSWANESRYPYRSVGMGCGQSRSRSSSKLDGHLSCSKDELSQNNFSNQIRQLEPGNESLLKFAISFYGPVLVTLALRREEFIFLSPDAIYREPSLEHGLFNARLQSVLLVGYGKDEEQSQEYWLVKNSWGQGWADRGYGRIARNANNTASISSNALIVLDINPPI